MRKFLNLTGVLSIVVLAMSAQNVLATANTIHLRTSCTENGTTIPSCYTDMASVNQQIVALAPDAASPLIIEVGPGQFTGRFVCNNVSHITLRGSGRSNTILGSYLSDDNSIGTQTHQLTNCDNLNVSNLQFQGFYYTIQWKGTGVTTWSDVDVLGSGIGWYDDSTVACDPARTRHYWYSSKIVQHPFLTQSAAYVSTCGEHWIYGSELVSTSETLAGVTYPAAGTNDVLRASKGSEIHVYGSALRALAPTNTTGNVSRFRVAHSESAASIHIHGTGIDAITDLDLNIEVLVSTTHGGIHANETAYNLKTGAGGSITRISDPSGHNHVHAPYLWQNSAEVPNITSVNGADMVVVTNTVDNQPHMLIYSTNCESKWFDIVTQSCR